MIRKIGSGGTWAVDCKSGSMTESRSMGPIAIWLEDVNSRDQNIKDKNFRDSGQMVTVGINFHF